ncbi:MAG: DNA-binding domain-containing protein [Hydrogenophaga sp.]|nr:DNA-binding domain-containing protein [Hydrogenophaga sp.]
MSPDANLALMPAFWQALLARSDTSALDAMEHITSQPGFAVYRNTCTKACVDALTAQFPSVSLLVGEAWFRAAATEHLRAQPPRDGRLLRYGEGFPRFLQHFAPATDLPYLAGVAQLDWLWTEAHSAADAHPLPPEALTTLDENALHNSHLQVHPAARWTCHNSLPLFSLWRAAREQRDDPNPAAWVGEGALITRPHDQVWWAPLSAGGNALMDACAAGQPIAQAIEAALTQEPTLDLGATLGLLLTQGAFTAVTAVHPTKEPT